MRPLLSNVTDAQSAKCKADTRFMSRPSGPGVRFEQQVRFHPRAYLAGVAKALRDKGVAIFEHSTADEFQEQPFGVKTNAGFVRCRDLVIAMMRDQGYVTRAAAERATSEPMRIAASRWRPIGRWRWKISVTSSRRPLHLPERKRRWLLAPRLRRGKRSSGQYRIPSGGSIYFVRFVCFFGLFNGLVQIGTLRMPFG